MLLIPRYPWSGEAVVHSRRDKRRGHHTGRVVRSPATGAPCIEVTWEDLFGGECKDTFELSGDGGTLVQVTEMRIRGSGRETRYCTTYRRVHT